MRDIKLGLDGDWDVSSGDLGGVDGADAIIQSSSLHLQFFKGEWFLDLGAGVPWFQSVLGKIRDPNILKPIFRKALLEPLGTVSVESLDLQIERSSRTLRVAFQTLSNVGLLTPTVVSVG